MSPSQFPPYLVARWGMYLAVGVAVLSVWLGQRAGASLDYSLLRAVFIFVIFTALGLGAEAVLNTNFVPSAAADPHAERPAEPEQHDE
ncbi:MAG: hypothetical protein IT303_14720 [Dehalococcoidia bacterium]|nr:hypothetical protein [Dehalococcoidia bacterium]